MRGWLCVGPWWFYLADISITLASQPSTFWAGDLASVEEGNPLARAVLRTSLSLFLLLALAWGVTFTLILLYWRHSWVWVMSFLLTFGHAVGAATWLPRHGWLGMIAAVGVLVLAERILTWTWAKAGPPPA